MQTVGCREMLAYQVMCKKLRCRVAEKPRDAPCYYAVTTAAWRIALSVRPSDCHIELVTQNRKDTKTSNLAHTAHVVNVTHVRQV